MCYLFDDVTSDKAIWGVFFYPHNNDSSDCKSYCLTYNESFCLANNNYLRFLVTLYGC